MKATSLRTAAVIASSIGLLAGPAMAQGTAVSGVVGYETKTLGAGFNFFAPRLHQNPVASGSFEAVTATTAQDADVDFGAVLGTSGASGTFILEIEDGSGIIQEVVTWTGDTLDVADLASVAGTTPSYTIRPADTIASIFGPANEAGLVAGGFGTTGADQIWSFNQATQTFSKIYYDDFGPAGQGAGYYDVNTLTAVDPTTIDLIYADGVYINTAAGGNSIVVSGDLKAGPTELNIGAGFNFVGSVAPVGANLETAFGAANEGGLTAGGFGTTGADQVWIFDGTTQTFAKYYYDDFGPAGQGGGWYNVVTLTAVDPATVSLEDASGFVINSASGGNVIQGVPAYYSGL